MRRLLERWCAAGWIAGAVGLLALAPGPSTAADKTAPPLVEEYAFGTPAFSQFVADSYRHTDGSAEEFFSWLRSAYETSPHRFPGRESLPLESLLEALRDELAEVTDPAARSARLREHAGWLHRWLKGAIPHFSLARGFEFYNTARRGERQCFLQSVLLAGLLQRLGADAGVIMVNRNPAGQETNNGHAVAVLKLPEGDLLVDASEQHPFARHMGLFLRVDGYRYVTPTWGPDGIIRGYRRLRSDRELATWAVRPLDHAFLRSQFAYYRGERVPGGLLAARSTPEGLEQAAAHLRESVRLCPDNPLAAYTLSCVYWKQGQAAAARAAVRQACLAYTRAGWLPAGPRTLRARLATGPWRFGAHAVARG